MVQAVRIRDGQLTAGVFSWFHGGQGALLQGGKKRVRDQLLGLLHADTGEGQDQVVRDVERVSVLLQLRELDGLQGLHWDDERRAEVAQRVGGLLEELGQDQVGLHPELVELELGSALLQSELLGRQVGLEDGLGQQTGDAVDVLVEHAGLIDHALSGRRAHVVSAEARQLARHRVARPLLRGLERHFVQQMRGAREAQRGLETRPRLEVEPHRRKVPGRLVHRERDAVGQLLDDGRRHLAPMKEW